MIAYIYNDTVYIKHILTVYFYMYLLFPTIITVINTTTVVQYHH